MYRLLLLLLLSLSGCTTRLWSPQYEEVIIDGFYVKGDTNQLFVTTQHTAYLFDIPRHFGETLQLSRRVEFYPRLKGFKVDENNHVEGEIELVLAERASTQEVLDELNRLGFAMGDTKQPTLTTKLLGQRYTVTGILPLEKLETPLPVMVEQPSTFTSTAGKIIATPAAITIDAVVVVPAVFFAAAVMAAGAP